MCRPTAAHAAASDIVSRAVEAGAQLLAAPPHDVRVIMQMPRGNLETVAPRALVLAAIADSLQARRAARLTLVSSHAVDRPCICALAHPLFDTCSDAHEMTSGLGHRRHVLDCCSLSSYLC